MDHVCADDLWKWSDGSVVDFKKWGLYEPSDLQGIALCVNMKVQVGTWNDFPCDRAHAFVCKIGNYSQGQYQSLTEGI